MRIPRSHLALITSAALVLSVVGSAGLNVVLASPTAPPPGGNIEAPLNAGPQTDVKSGGLTLGDGTMGKTLIDLLGGGLHADGPIDSSASVNAPLFCIGTSCISSWGGLIKNSIYVRKMLIDNTDTSHQYVWFPGGKATGTGGIFKDPINGLNSVNIGTSGTTTLGEHLYETGMEMYCDPGDVVISCELEEACKSGKTTYSTCTTNTLTASSGLPGEDVCDGLIDHYSTDPSLGGFDSYRGAMLRMVCVKH